MTEKIREAKRIEREERILDVAGELLLRYGYKKTALDDIARQARVAKGTLYLHWRSREELFVSLVMRETKRAAREIVEHLQQEQEGLYLHTITRHAFAVALQRPLLRAILLGDQEMLGELVQLLAEYAPGYAAQRLAASRQLLAILRTHKMMRSDRRIEEQLQSYNALLIGFLCVNQYVPEELQLSEQDNVELLVDAIQRIFGPAEALEKEKVQEVSRELREIFESFLKRLEQQDETAWVER